MKTFPGSIILILTILIKICKSIGILYRTRCILSKILQKQLYFSFLNFYLDYANIAWASTNKIKVQALYHHQKHAARTINFKGKFTSANPLLEQINAKTVYKMNIFQTLCFMYLCKNGNTPSIFKHIYKLKPFNKYTTKSKNILFKPLCKKNFAKFKLSYRGPDLWNEAIAPNNDLLEAVTIHIFKILLKKIIFASANIL